MTVLQAYVQCRGAAGGSGEKRSSGYFLDVACLDGLEHRVNSAAAHRAFPRFFPRLA